jgi:hypothetical protein
MTIWMAPGVYMTHTHDHRKVYTKHPSGPLRIEDYQWVYSLEKGGIPMLWTEWLEANCLAGWGWWFDPSGVCQVGFSEMGDMVNFVLTYTDD